MSEHIINVNDETFEQTVLQSQLPVLVDYWAEWCQPCKQIIPILDELAEHYKDRLIIAKLNIDQSSATPTKYGVRGIPTLMLFKNGQLEATKVGSEPKVNLTTWLDRLL
jgi:thioredoxin 1